MIVATAGHIDHGKTMLVKALTGVDTDRLPEERKRGLTIDLGFAYQQIGEDDILGFVDVPGHERFVRTMIAGVTGIDYALLVVAADDGPMPQTIEHLAILDLLGIAGGAVVITKVDKVPLDRIATVSRETASLVSGSILERAPVYYVSATTGEGVSDLRAHLQEIAVAAVSRRAAGHFRLAVDRAFTVSGAGLVVTGAVFSGAVRVGERVLVSPTGIPARVRGIHALNRDAEEGRAGQRCALNLAGQRLDKSTVSRGDWIVAEPAHSPTARIDARIRLLAAEQKSLRHWTPVHVHLGAADVPGRVALLEDSPIDPGHAGRVQVVLDRAIAALWGDRLILRDQSARRTIAGGRVIDPFAPSRGRARPERLIALAAMERPEPGEALTALLEASPNGVDLARFAQSRNLSEAESAMLRDAVPMVLAGDEAGSWGFAEHHWKSLLECVKESIRNLHEKQPDQPGISLSAVSQALARRTQRAVVAGLVRELVAAGDVVQSAGSLHLRGMKGGLESPDAEMWSALRWHLEKSGLRPPSVSELAEALEKELRVVERVLRRAARLGLVVQVARNRFFLPATLRALGEAAAALAIGTADGTFSAAEFRDRTGIGRNLSIEVMEFFDRIGFTRRAGDRRRLLRPVTDVSWSRAA